MNTPANTPQAAILDETSTQHLAIEYIANEGLTAAGLGAAWDSTHDMAIERGFRMMLAFGADFWRRSSPAATPPNLAAFDAIGAAPASGGDVFLWLHGTRPDDLLDAALNFHTGVTGKLSRIAETPGFIRHEKRDLTGFVDGTANPKDDARKHVALVPPGQPGGGGSFVFSQRWVHDLMAFNALPVEEQERVIGRTKVDSIELEGDAMPADSHVSRTDVKIDGVAQKIYRRSFPYGGVAEHGLYFLAFACDPARITVQLERMYGTTGDGLRDRIIDYSRAVSGAFWFAPSVEDRNAALGL